MIGYSKHRGSASNMAAFSWGRNIKIQILHQFTCSTAGDKPISLQMCKKRTEHHKKWRPAYWNSDSSWYDHSTSMFRPMWPISHNIASLSCMLYDFLYRFTNSTSFCQPPLSIYCTLFKKSLQYYIEQSREKRGTFGECTMKAVKAVLESITKCTFFLSALFRLM